MDEFRIREDQVAEILSPSLVVFVDKVRDNLARMRDYLGGDLDRWRAHVKTTKTPRIWQELVRFGLRSFKCATPREAEHLLSVLSADGIDGADVLVAYPHRGPAVQRIAALAERHPQVAVSLLSEDPDHVDSIPPSLGIFVDVNPGMNRTGVPMTDSSTILAVASRAGRRFRGVHFYEGHIRNGATEDRRQQCFSMYEDLLVLLRKLADGGVAVPELVTSGTPSFLQALAFEPFTKLEPTRHRVSPGTVVYHDFGSDDMVEELELWPAALVLTRVVSHPAPGFVTCDAGSKSIAAEAGDPCVRVLGRPELVARKPSEEHLPLEVTAGERPSRGEVLLLIPRHVCPTVNLAEHAVLVEGGEVSEIVPVAARAHDVVMR